MFLPKLTKFAMMICLGAVLLGQLSLLTFFTTPAAAANPLPLPTQANLLDEDNQPFKIKGSLEFRPPSNESNKTDYAIYTVDSQGGKLQHLGDVNVKKQQENLSFSQSIGVKFTNYSFEIKNLTLSESAVKFGIYPKNADGESETGYIFPIWDNPRHLFPDNLAFTDHNKMRDQVEPVLQWKGIPDEKVISGYKIYYKQDGATKELTSNQVDVKKGKTAYTYMIPQGALPLEATEFMVYFISEEGIQGYGTTTKGYDDISEEPIVQLTTSSLIPQPVISSIGDGDKVTGTMDGMVSFTVKDDQYSAQDPSSRASDLVYAVYFLDAKKNKLQGIVKIPKGGKSTGTTSSYGAKIPAGTVIPKEAVSIGVFAQMATSEGDLFGDKGFWDSPLNKYQAKNLTFTDMDPLPQSVKAKINWQAADDESPMFGYAIYLDWKYASDSKPYTIIEKGKKEYEFTFPDGALTSRGHAIYVLPVNDLSEIALESTAPESFVRMTDTTNGQKASLENVNLPLKEAYFFEDTDARPGFIGGKVHYTRPDNAAAIEIFYVDTLNRKRDSIAELDCTGTACGYWTYDIPTGTPIPDGAAYIGTRARMKDGSIKPLTVSAIKDKSSDHPVTFPDLPDSFIGKKEIERIGSMNLINGYEDGSFGPDKEVTRAEFAAMLVRAFHLTSTESGKTTFSDVSASDWFGNAVATAVEYKLLSGYEDGTFRPNQFINRAEMAVMVFNAYHMVFNGFDSYTMKYIEYADNYSIPEWAQGPVSANKYYDFAPPLWNFEPTKPVPRAEAAVMLYRLLERYNLVDRF